MAAPTKKTLRKNKYDWPKAKALFLEGFSLTRVSEKCGINIGTLRSKSFKDQWTLQRKALNSVLDKKVTENFIAKKTKDAELFLEEHANDAKRILDTLKAQNPANIDEILKHEQASGANLKRGRSAYGIDDRENKENAAINALVMAAKGVSEGELGEGSQEGTKLVTGDPTPTSGPIVIDID